jgi:hypothetical protein
MLVRKFPRRTVIILLTAALALAACNVGATPAPTVDINAINTAAVATAMGQISAQLTQTALSAPSSPTPQPTDTSLPLATFALPTSAAGSPVAGGALPTVSFNTTPSTNTTPLAGFTPIGSPIAPAATTSLGDACNNNVYIADVTYPDNTEIKPGVDFKKIWRVQNTGTCTWDEGYKLAFISGDKALDPVSFEFKSSDDFVAAGATADIGVNLTAPLKEGTYSAMWKMQSDSGVYFGTPLTVVVVVKK